MVVRAVGCVVSEREREREIERERERERERELEGEREGEGGREGVAAQGRLCVPWYLCLGRGKGNTCINLRRRAGARVRTLQGTRVPLGTLVPIVPRTIEMVVPNTYHGVSMDYTLSIVRERERVCVCFLLPPRDWLASSSSKC
jgi:hypothetical protein